MSFFLSPSAELFSLFSPLNFLTELSLFNHSLFPDRRSRLPFETPGSTGAGPRHKTLSGSLLQQEGTKTGNNFPCLLPQSREQAGSLYRVRAEECPGVGSEGWLKWSTYPFDGIVCKGHAQYLAFAPGLSEANKQLRLFGLFVSCP